MCIYVSGPIVEVIEAEELDDEEGSTTSTTVSEQDYIEFMNASPPKEGESVKKEETNEAATGGKDKTEDGGTAEKSPEETTAKEEEIDTQKEDGSEKTDENTDQEASKEGGSTVEAKDKEPETDPTDNQSETTPAQSGGEPQPQDVGEGDQKEPPNRATSSARPPHSVSVLEGRLRAKSTSISLMRRLSGMSVTHPMGVSGPGLPWDHCVLSCAQFVQLVELLLGPEPEDSTVDAISTFFRNNYTETAQVSGSCNSVMYIY